MSTRFAVFFVSAVAGSDAADELNRFLQGHSIVDIAKQPVVESGSTGWMFLVEYLDARPEQAGGKPPRIDYQEILSAEEFALFNKLRQLRSETAERRAQPVYAIFTNEHLAEMVRRRPATLADLGAIPGIGKSRVAQYGLEFVEMVQQVGHETVQQPVRSDPVAE